MQLYRELREQQIADTTVLFDPRPVGHPRNISRSSTSIITRLTNDHHHYSHIGHHMTYSGVCRCHGRDEISHDPARIPRMLAQTSCRPYRPRRTTHYSVECEEVYRNERVKRRHGCVNVALFYPLLDRTLTGCSMIAALGQILPFLWIPHLIPLTILPPHPHPPFSPPHPVRGFPGVYQYIDAWESIPVGCSCHVYPRAVASRE
ncbi:hypothetical protein ElyMa_000760400 [Elysia marginata]|uniref:Uncharacterized protein n=1 Tax=Elysia marginata TaxID=1093978 RepID=A0AAV4GRW0_9GAST|nr:hypothetical protein ElyMa_000760400 [Elysia marginata]